MKTKKILGLILAIALVCSVFSGISLIGVNAGATSISTDLNKELTGTNYGAGAKLGSFNGTYANYTVQASDTSLGLTTGTVIGRFTQTTGIKRWNAPRVLLTDCHLDTSSASAVARKYVVVLMMYNNNSTTYAEKDGKKIWPNVVATKSESGTTRAVNVEDAVGKTYELPYGQWVKVELIFTAKQNATDLAIAMDGSDTPFGGATAWYVNGVAQTAYENQIALVDCFFYVTGVYKVSEYDPLIANGFASFTGGAVAGATVDSKMVVKATRICSGDGSANYQSFGWDVTDFVKANGTGFYTITTKMKEADDSAYKAGSTLTPYLSSGDTHATNSTAFTVTNSAWTDVNTTIEITDAQLATAGTTWTFRVQGTNTIAGSDIFYVQDITMTYSATAPTTPPTATTAPTATPVPAKTVVNGNAESGTEGWGVFTTGGGGTVTQVSGGANGTSKAIQFTGATGIYSSIAFNMGAAIVDDPANGYQGGGAGKYTFTFYAKLPSTATVDTATFKFVLNSQCHKEATAIPGIVGSGTASDYVQTYLTNNAWTVEMTKEWKKFTLEVEIPQIYMDTVKALYAAGQTTAYDLILRLDGSTLALKDLSGTALSSFAYLVDEVTIVAPVKATPDSGGNTPTPQIVKGRQFTFTKDTTYFCGATWTVVTADMVKNGTVTFKVTIGNAGDEAISLTATLQVYTTVGGSAKWEDVEDVEKETYELEPNEAYTFTVTAAAESTLGDDDTKYSYTSYFLRLDGNITEGAKLILAGMSPENLAKITFGGATAEDLYQLPTWMNKVVTDPSSSGDTILYASAAGAVLSAVALAYVVCRKKNEEEA